MWETTLLLPLSFKLGLSSKPLIFSIDSHYSGWETVWET